MNKIFRVLQYVWATPNTILGLVVMLFSLPTSLKWHRGCLEATTKTLYPWWTPVVGQTWGFLILYRKQPNVGLERHERQHVVQGLRFGPLFLLIYPIACLVALVKGKRAYRDNYFELEADTKRRTTPDYHELNVGE